MKRKSLFCIVLTAVLIVSMGAVAYADPGGMGLPDAEGEALTNMIDSGVDPYDAFAQMYGITPSGPINSGGGSSSTQAPSASIPSTSTTAPKSAPAPAPTPATDSTPKSSKETKQSSGGVSHDYDSITDAARDAFVYFTHDGKANSCYLNIKSTSSENKITGKELNATRTGKEDGKISFVDGKNVISEWVFHNWKSDDKAEFDLTASFKKKDKDSFTLSFAKGSLESNDVTFRVNTGLKATKLYIYKDGDKTNKLIYSGTTDKDGFLELHPQELGKYIITKTEMIAK